MKTELSKQITMLGGRPVLIPLPAETVGSRDVTAEQQTSSIL